LSGIYIHIPFCKQKCSYCDFHFSTVLKYKSDLLKALIIEIEQQKEWLKTPVKTIYFGGGTPSLLTINDLKLIVNALYKNYNIAEKIEFTLECNPDDLTLQKLKALKKIGVNRLSIGIQSFFNDDLQFFNRAHNAQEAEKSILMSQDAGFKNITIDLIYGTPILTIKQWEQNLKKVAQLNIPHLSAYSLTIEGKTALHHQVKTGKITPLNDKKTILQFKLLMQQTSAMRLTQYEVSNFGKEGHFSQHNSNYWKGVEYLGFGPAAHSFVNNKRFWNVANNAKYIKAIHNKLPYFEEEIIDEKTAYNEYVLTRLRTIWGINVNYIDKNFSNKIKTHFKKELTIYINSPYLRQDKNIITLTKEGIFIADKITSDLFFII